MTLSALKSHFTKQHYAETPVRPTSLEAQSAFLKSYDFLVLIDRSGSMDTIEDKEENLTRWDIVKEELQNIVNAAIEFDPNGIDVCFFGERTKWVEEVESNKTVTDLFKKIQPAGCTNMAKALDEAFKRHFNAKEKKPDRKTIVLVITDGIPYDGHDQARSKRAVANAIVEATKKLSKEALFKYQQPGKKSCLKTAEIGVRFFQVGNDRDAKKYLAKLDDDLSDAKADIVDTGDIEELKTKASVREAFINAIFD